MLTMVLLGLFAGVNTVWAQEEPEVNPMTDYYWARLIAQPSTGTGGTGKVYATTTTTPFGGSNLRPYDYDNPVWRSDTSRADGYCSIYVEINMGNSTNVSLQANALPDEGSYFAGWSYRNGETDLGLGNYESDRYVSPQYVLPSKKYGFSNIREYNIYATFLPLLIESYTISGSKTTESRTCTQEVIFRVAGALADVNDFEVPTIIKQTGTGTWTVEPNTEEKWHSYKPASSDYKYSVTYGNPYLAEDQEYYAEIRVPVTFTAEDDNAGEFSATLQLRSKAGKTMNVVLSARTTGGDHQAIRYSKTNEWEAQGDLSAMISGASEGDIIKLNGDYSSPVSINKDITFDLNGYTLSNTLTVSGGNVTLAYSPFGGSANSLIVSGGKAVLNGGTYGILTVSSGAEVELNGATINGPVNNNGTLTTTDGVVSGCLTSGNALTVNGGTFTNETGEAIVISGGNAKIKRGTITGSTYGVKTTGGSTTIEKLAAITGGTKALYGNGGSLTVNNGKFASPNTLADGTITFVSAYFQENNDLTSYEGKHVWRNTAGVEFREGYKYFVGNQEAAQASNVSVCRIGQAAYASLEEALAYAANHTAEQVLIFMENDYTLKAGYYTVPANATVVVPKSNDQNVPYTIVEHISIAAGSTYPTPYPFRTLTLENGVNLNVLGAIELTCPQYCKTGAREQAMPGGPFGHMVLKPGSHITLSSGSELRAWGYVTGDGTQDANGTYLSGEIDARRGSIVREQFQMGDWKGGDISFTMIYDVAPQNMTRLFPIYTYFIQNVESPVKYHPGSSLVCATSVDVSYVNAYANEIKVVGKEGEPAMFLMNEMADAENTWVRKWYDANKDQQVYEVNSGAKLGSLVIDLGEVPEAFFGNGGLGKYHIVLDSRKYVLPLTNNFKIHLLSGNMQFTQSTSCLPGMEVEVDKESEISIIPNDDPTVTSGALYFYDADQWSFMNNQMLGYVGLAGDANKFGRIVHYSATLNAKPAVRDISSPATIGDAKLIVHGTFRSAEGCSVYTTWSKGSAMEPGNNPFEIYEDGTGGASIISTNEDAGTFIFDDVSPEFDGVHWDSPENFGQINHLTGFGNSVLVNFDNNNYGDASYPIAIPTVLKTREYQSKLEQYQGYQDLCKYYTEEPHWAEYQQYCTKAEEMENNGSLDINNYTTRMYGFELCTPAMLKNGDGTFVATSGSPAGTSYCYMNDRWTTMKVAEENECFMKDNFDVFYAKPSEYVAVAASVVAGNVVGNDDHTFSDAAGAGRLFIVMDDCQWWEVEKKDNLYHCIHPNNDTYYYWDEGESKWMEQRFTITWKNWDGEEIKSYTYDPVTGDPEEVEYSVTYGTQAEYLGSNPTRPENIDYTYNFTGWSPALGKVTSDVTYTATYEAQPRKYTIIFENEGGNEIERQFLLHNDVPVCENTPTRTGFTLEWEPAIAAVVGDATYRATWLENPPTEYQITFVDYDGDIENHLLWQGNVTVGTVPTPPVNPSGKPETDEYTYVFDHWSPALEAVSATSAKTYTAVYREVAKTYTVRFYQENGNTQIGEAQSLAYGEMPVAPTPTKQDPQTGYTYTYVWQNKADASKALETVKEDANYKAVFTGTPNKYTVTVKSNPSGACSSTGAGLYDYNTSATLTLSVNSGYTFTGWSDGLEGTNTTRTITVTEDKELVANFTVADPDYTITWKSEDGSETLAEVGQKAGTATTFTGAIPTKDAEEEWTYTFDGWATEANGERAYKNGLTPVATANATYYAHFNKTKTLYTITWANEAGTANIEVDYDQPYGAAIVYNSATPTKQATVEATYTFDGWSTSVNGDVVTLPAIVEGDATFYAHFSAATKTYTITWLNEDGSMIGQTVENYGATLSPAAPMKEDCSFSGWTPGLVPVTGPATYQATFNCEPVINNIEVGQSETVEIDDTQDVSAVIIAATGTLTLEGTASVTTDEFILESNTNQSGQLVGAPRLNVTGDAYFDVKFNGEAGTAHRTWYAIAVPWEVDAENGILWKEGNRKLVLGSDFDLVWYDGAERAANGDGYACWKYVELQTDKKMHPGKMYMMYFGSQFKTVRFKKTSTAPILYTGDENAVTSVTPYDELTDNDGKDANWNGIANPAVFHATLNAGVTHGQVLGNGNLDAYFAHPEVPVYSTVSLSSYEFVVGKPVFVQAGSYASVVVNSVISDAALAPRRAAAENASVEFALHIGVEGHPTTDNLFVQIADEKENRYVIGQDLAKGGVAKTCPQLWVNRYNTKLSVNTQALVNNVAEYPLGIYVPNAGAYVINMDNAREDYDLYLTLDGNAIWNLSTSEYIATLPQGTTNSYGLRAVAKSPQTATGVDEAIVDAQGDVRKVLINDQVFIIRGDKVYSIDGQLVK